MNEKNISSIMDHTIEPEKHIGPPDPTACEICGASRELVQIYPLHKLFNGQPRGICEYHWDLLSAFVKEMIFDVFFLEGLDSFLETYKKEGEE